MPRHVNPKTKDRIAFAPYNFVPLPNKVYTVADGFEIEGEKNKLWKMHDQFVPGTCNGWIELTIETLTPLFIRGPVTRKNGEWDRRDTRLRPDFFTTPQGKPLIPGSSLRGMVRTLVEILSFAKIAPVTNERPFFRTVANDRIGDAYRKRMIRGSCKPDGGYIEKERDQYFIVPAEKVLRVHRNLLNKLGLDVPNQPDANYRPKWEGQQKRCWFKRDPQKNKNVADISLDKPNGTGWEEGTLVLTGSAPKKEYDFVFVGRKADQKILITGEKWERFHDDDQITQWQEKAFPKNEPNCSCRKAQGYLRHGEPIFFLTGESTENSHGELVFFGRAQMFRFPYDLSPLDLIPEKIKNADLDLAEAMFGLVRQEKEPQADAIKGRVFFEDAEAVKGGPDWFEEIIVPRILSSPKATCFQHYLTQDGTKDEGQLTTYLQGDYTTIRGHKLYWHRWEENKNLDTVKESNNYPALRKDLQSKKPKDRQHTLIRPVKSRVTFSGRIRFENLSAIELGALLSALRLPEGCRHKLGMGKPLGLGSVRIEPKLFLIDREKRYACWEDNSVKEDDGASYEDAFAEAMLAHARSSGETLFDENDGLRKIARLNALYRLLTWEDRPQLKDTDYMTREGFNHRPVLPTPHNVIKEKEPEWPSNPPRPASEEKENHSLKTAALPKASEVVDAVLLEEKTKKGGWKAKHEASGLSGPIQNTKDVPKDKHPGDWVLLKVAFANQKEIGFRWPT
ncbi:MAG TPA: TIGR03986 family CRISPR-associated RAMP protein [Firmicutes bacterium]|nr:TIGR03986 family CRISPR-associated RAMP protein [Bacillota bacterium]